MLKISAIIITYNEEKNISRCIESIREIVDEIIIVDSFSTDKTEEISRRYNVKFIKREFKGYSDQKNYAMTQAENDLILSLDADEAVSNKLKDRLEEEVLESPYDAYYINRLTNYCGKWIKHSGWYPDKKLRLYNRKACKWNSNKVHENIEFPKNIKTKKLKGNILHYSFSNISEHIKQIDKFSQIKAEELKENGEKTNLFIMVFKPVLKFFINYFLKLGFMDGFYGYIVCRNSAFAYFLRYAKLKSLYKNAR